MAMTEGPDTIHLDPDEQPAGSGARDPRMRRVAIAIGVLIVAATGLWVGVSQHFAPHPATPATTAPVSRVLAGGNHGWRMNSDGTGYLLAVGAIATSPLRSPAATIGPLTAFSSLRVTLVPGTTAADVLNASVLPTPRPLATLTGDFAIVLTGQVDCHHLPTASQEPRIAVSYLAGAHRTSVTVTGMPPIDPDDLIGACGAQH
jgi:hypothetical protein